MGGVGKIGSESVTLARGKPRSPRGQRQLVTEGYPATNPLLRPFGELAVVVEAAETEADLRVKQVRVLEADRIPLEFRAWDGLRAEPLTIATPSRAVANVVPTGREFGPVEVLFVKDHRAEQTGVRVDADAEHQPAGAGLGDRGLQVKREQLLIRGIAKQRLGIGDRRPRRG